MNDLLKTATKESKKNPTIMIQASDYAEFLVRYHSKKEFGTQRIGQAFIDNFKQHPDTPKELIDKVYNVPNDQWEELLNKDIVFI